MTWIPPTTESPLLLGQLAGALVINTLRALISLRSYSHQVQGMLHGTAHQTPTLRIASLARSWVALSVREANLRAHLAKMTGLDRSIPRRLLDLKAAGGLVRQQQTEGMGGRVRQAASC